jgi:hypothetical protein
LLAIEPLLDRRQTDTDGILRPALETKGQALALYTRLLAPVEGETVQNLGVLCPPLAVVGRGHDAVADHAGVGRA